MMSIQKRKSSTCVPEKSRKRSKRPSGSELTQPTSEHAQQHGQQQQQQQTDESVWIFGLINNIEQLLSTFNGACSANSGASSGTSTPSSASSPASSSGSCRSSHHQSATCTGFSSPAQQQGSCAPSTASTLPHRHSLSRQIKFHEYKGPPTARRASGSSKQQTTTSTGHSQPVQRLKQAQLAQPLAPKSEPPSQVHHQHPYLHQEEPCGQPHQHQHQHQPPLPPQPQAQQQQQPSCSGFVSNSSLPLRPQQATHASRDLLHFQAAAQCSSIGPATNQLTSVGQPMPLHGLSCAHQGAMLDNNKTGAAPSSLAEAELLAVDAAERLGWRLAAEQPAPVDWQHQQQPQHRQPQHQPLIIQEPGSHAGKPAGGQAAFALSTDSDDETDTNEIEPSIDFGLGGEELLFSEFIDLQDVPLNVEESDWLKKFLPPCSMGG